jgi:hypothetical protein
MLYLVTGKLVNREPMSKPHEEFVEFLRDAIRPSLTLLEQFRSEGLLLAGGVRAGAQSLVFILEMPPAQSHIEVRRLLLQLRVFANFEWDVAPLESFQDWLSFTSS